ncbi:type I-E CRISPR-associated protein Cse2/CasB [Corynebacterium amycolatum]|uniref:type I-E CRISPR-associated protein Cse2/CasB n=1 Tax=Corynebacterium amycolatum TaxID=43765 RepID=UPI001CCE2703|nr:type I-E CRISPR-associated protein Cse2/CasB [Corynebacterium amycolatum]MCA0443250.1 type I-E CRISPR-associated protein Cse2/CasB [Corynebacterium amycolatum]MDC7115771.1 type I-E CRISPR-associated protein Cse2/CasB [Corynebacterium amycolatum]
MTSSEANSVHTMWATRLASVLALRDDANIQSPRWRKTRAELRRGASPATEHYAYPHVLPYADPTLSDHQITSLVRLFALVAEFDQVPHYRPPNTTDTNGQKKIRRIGHWARQVSIAQAKKTGEQFQANPDDLDSVGQRLQFIYSLDAEEAILNVSRILKIATALPGPIPALDYYDLFRTFLYWGNGFTPESQNIRRRMLRDYFSYFAEIPETSSNADNDNKDNATT